ncbi:MAG: hypothetical protein V4481_02990, partial [Patescibacteria group bacterium]
LELQRKPSLIPAISYENSFTIDPDKIREVLAIDITNEEMTSLLERLDIKVEAIKEDGTSVLKLSIPSNRLDLKSWRDIPEEVARIWGYDKIPATIPPINASAPKPEKNFYYTEKIRSILCELGFSEVYTYSLTSAGEFHIEKSVASDKNYLRTDLTQGIARSLELNARNADLLGLDEIKIFEIGKVFPIEGERTSLAIGIKNVKKSKEKAKDKIKALRDALLKIVDADATILCTVDDSGGLISIAGKTIGMANNTEGIMELDLDALVETLPAPTSYDDLKLGKASMISYQKFSQYPFIVRDIAVFVPETISVDEVWGAIQKGINDSGAVELVARHSLFDTFKKDGKVSYAYRIVFQSMDKTLTDEEINKVMEKINGEVRGKSWEVR